MKIKLYFIHPNNTGNLMMASVFINNFYNIAIEQYRDKPIFITDVLDDIELERLQNTLPKEIRHQIQREDLFDRKKRGITGKLLKLAFLPVEIDFCKKNYDACVVLGGDCISQYYSKQVFITDMLKIGSISKRVPTFLAGQTMGPFRGYGKNIVRRQLAKCYIYLRDMDCYKYMKENFKFQKLYETRDLAFLDLPFQNNGEIKKFILKKYLNKTDNYVTIVASGANKQYTSSFENYITQYIKIIEYIIDNYKHDILLLAHVIHNNASNDKPIISAISQRISNEYKKHLMIVDTLLYPHEVRTLIGNGRYTITGRMHAAVSSLNQNVIPICLSYSVKYKGVIGDEFDLNDYIIQCRGDEHWKNDEVSKSVERAIDNLELNRVALSIKVKEILEAVKKKSLTQIKSIVDNAYK